HSTTGSISAGSFASKPAYTAVAASPTIKNVSNDTSTVCSSPILLPIGLVSFNGEVTAKGNYLYWETASEFNNNYFTLEKSEDGQTFTEVSQITGAGTTNIPQSYNAWDNNPSSGWNYYRLKQTDFDGKISYSSVIALEDLSNQNLFVAVSPNPTSADFQMEINDQSDASVKIEITDLSGSLLKTWNEKIVSGKNLSAVSLANLTQGIYLMKIFSEQNAILFTQKIEKY
ncbi:MAG: T9SS type A sorting domain-containing protein, partial [Chitinophagales bacterium]